MTVQERIKNQKKILTTDEANAEHVKKMKSNSGTRILGPIAESLDFFRDFRVKVSYSDTSMIIERPWLWRFGNIWVRVTALDSGKIAVSSHYIITDSVLFDSDSLEGIMNHIVKELCKLGWDKKWE